jgi:hypothetical protein
MPFEVTKLGIAHLCQDRDKASIISIFSNIEYTAAIDVVVVVKPINQDVHSPKEIWLTIKDIL